MDNGGEEAGNHLEGEGHAVRLGGGPRRISANRPSVYIFSGLFISALTMPVLAKRLGTLPTSVSGLDRFWGKDLPFIFLNTETLLCVRKPGSLYPRFGGVRVAATGMPSHRAVASQPVLDQK